MHLLLDTASTKTAAMISQRDENTTFDTTDFGSIDALSRYVIVETKKPARIFLAVAPHHTGKEWIDNIGKENRLR